jgi:hypothetical protein
MFKKIIKFLFNFFLPPYILLRKKKAKNTKSCIFLSLKNSIYFFIIFWWKFYSTNTKSCIFIIIYLKCLSLSIIYVKNVKSCIFIIIYLKCLSLSIIYVKNVKSCIFIFTLNLSLLIWPYYLCKECWNLHIYLHYQFITLNLSLLIYQS